MTTNNGDMPASAMTELSTTISEILTGIDQCENECDLGWWESSCGAKFGERKLDAVKSAVDAKIAAMQKRVDEQGEQLRRVEDAARGALSDLQGLLSEQVHDDEGCYKYDGQSAYELNGEIVKTRLIFDGFDDNHKKLESK